MTDIMAGKSSGRTHSATGPHGRFTASWDGYTAAELWRDGMTQGMPEQTARWAVLERGGYVWALPPAMAEQAEADPSWVPPWPFGLLPLAEKERLCAEASAAGLPAPGVVPPDPNPPRPKR